MKSCIIIPVLLLLIASFCGCSDTTDPYEGLTVLLSLNLHGDCSVSNAKVRIDGKEATTKLQNGGLEIYGTVGTHHLTVSMNNKYVYDETQFFGGGIAETLPCP